MAELAPRDVVARGVFARSRPVVAHSSTARPRSAATSRPNSRTVYGYCQAAGIDPVTQPIPVAPRGPLTTWAAFLTDGEGRTSLDGLWAAGEVTSTGVHGANRLASNSLLEAVVFAARIAEDIQGLLPSPKLTPWPAGEMPSDDIVTEEDSPELKQLRLLMTAEMGVCETAMASSGRWA